MSFLRAALWLALPCSAVAQTGVTPISWIPFTYSSLAGEAVPADSARVIVPENRLQPTASRIQLAVVRIRTTAAKPGAPIFYFAGGPGGAAIAGVRGDLWPTLMALREVSDIILVDQRGTGTTLPSLFTRTTMGVSTMIDAASPDAKAALVARSRSVADDMKARGIDLSAYNTIENAADIDDVRTAIGANKIIIWGHSYGSHLGLAYIKYHEPHVERAMLGGINGLDQRRRHPKDADILLARIDSVVRATPMLRAVMPDFLGTVKEVLAKLERELITVQVDTQKVHVSKADVQIIIALQSGEQSFVRRLPLIVSQMADGDFSWIARQVRDVIKSRPFGTAMSYAMDLASGVSSERAGRIKSEAPTAILGNAINFPFDDPDFQAVWTPRDLGNAFRAPLKTNIPALFISGTLDGRTSLADAEEVRRGFRSSSHLILDGASHNPYALTTKLRDAMVAFARGETVRSAHLTVPPVEFRGPGEGAIVAELRQLAVTQGGAAAAKRLKELAAPSSGRYVSSVVVSDVVVTIATQDKKTEDAGALLQAGLELFPAASALHARMGEFLAAKGDKSGATSAYQKALAADPFNQGAAAALRRLGV